MVDRARGFVLQFNEVDHCKSPIVQNALNALMLFPVPDLYTRFCVSAFSCDVIFSGVHRVFVVVLVWVERHPQ